MQGVHVKLHPGPSRKMQRSTIFQIGLKFKEETSKVLKLWHFGK